MAAATALTDRTDDTGGTLPSRQRALFEDRYGDGAYERLIAGLRQPCVSFAEIAARFGVSRERVRQWRRQFLPDAPSGHERRRQCAMHRQRRRLLTDPLFREFFRQAREHLPGSRIEPVRTRSGYRARGARVDGRLVALRDLTRRDRSGTADVHGRLAPLRFRGDAEFVYVRLGVNDFLFVPAAVLSRRVPAPEAPTKLAAFRNSLSAFPRLGDRPTA